MPAAASSEPGAWEPEIAAGIRQIEGADRSAFTSPEQTPPPDALDPETAPMLERVDQAKKSAEVSVILAALNTTRWNRRQAADLLKVDYKALLYKMKKLQINA